ncbi:MAG: hypothetical protein ACK456_07270 [Pseudanabaenaceae cyanobacterium]
MSISTPHNIDHATPNVMPLNNLATENLGSKDGSMTQDVTWHNLRQVIAASSGFETWSDSRAVGTVDRNLDELVRRYLRETLETLAY